MKKLLALLCLVFTCAVLCFGVTACTKPTEQTHVHSYTAVATMPTCTEMGYTTHTCSCGETYVDSYTSKLGHDFASYTSDGNATCTADGTETAKCSNPGCSMTDTRTQANSKLDHSFVLTIAEDKYLDEPATCTSKATYYKSCVCGLAGAETFEYGEKLDHSYVLTVAEDRYLDEPATCTSKATYYKSCECGLAGTETFEYGEMLDHNYKNSIADEVYLKAPATCISSAIYYKSCECGAIGTETFEVGGFISHVYENGVCNGCFDSKYFNFTLLIDGTYSISALRSVGQPAELIIPATYKGAKVSTIAKNGFSGIDSFSSLIISDGVQIIDEDAFNSCYGLVSIVIPDSVTTIGAEAFYDGYEIKKLTIGNGVTSIGNGAFDYCSWIEDLTTPAEFLNYFYKEDLQDYLKTVTITKGNIGNNAFYGCKNLEAVIIGEGVTKIGDSAFSHCDVLSEVVVPDSVKKIGAFAFSNSKGLISVKIGNGVTEIGDSLFGGSINLTDVVIGNGITKFTDMMFANCESLMNITIGCNVKEIYFNSDMFANCFNITNFVVDSNNQYYKSIDGSVYSKDGKKLLRYAIGRSNANFKIPDGVQIIEADAFSNADYLLRVEFPSSVETIGRMAFYHCDKLKTVQIPNNVKTIGYEAFMSCRNLISVEIGDGITTISNMAFSGCENLSSVIIGRNVSVIEDYAFSWCDRLNRIYHVRTLYEMYNSSIEVGYDNNYENASKYYYSETRPTDTDYSYWHYGTDGTPIIWGIW